MPASRSTHVTIINNLDVDLRLHFNALDHGIWSDDLSPPTFIPAGGQGVFQAESNGFMTGDEGTVRYSSPVGTFTFSFDNPWNGSNSYDQSAPDGYTASSSGGRGDNATVTWTVYSS